MLLFSKSKKESSSQVWLKFYSSNNNFDLYRVERAGRRRRFAFIISITFVGNNEGKDN